MTHTCKICSKTSDDVEFYQSVTTRCKECHKAKSRENRAAKVDYYRAYDAKRFQEDPRVRERHRRYQGTDAGKASIKKAKRKWLEGNPEKRAAHVLMGNAVRDGRLEKPKTCSICGASGRIHGHHEDYARPLDVIWCCQSCHWKLHEQQERSKE